MSTDHLNGFLDWLKQTLASESLAGVTDHQLLERFLSSHDERAFRVIISRHGPMVYRVCRRVLADEQETEDAFQAAFVILIRKAGSIRKRMSLASWLHGVAYQVALRVRTSSRRRRVRENQAAGQEEAIAADDRSWREVRSILDEELARLPEKLRAPLILCYLEGLTQDEAAEQLKHSKRTLRRYLERGRMLLGTRLTRRGLALSGALMTTLISECVEAMPPGLERATAVFGDAVRSRHLTTIPQTVSTLAEEVSKKMFPKQLNLKWIAVALLGLGLGSVALSSLLPEGQTSEVGLAIEPNGKTVPVIPSRTAREPVPVAGQKRFEAEVANARKKAIEFLKRKQTKDGQWDDVLPKAIADMEGGTTALVTLSLLEAGVPVNDEAIGKAVEYLAGLPCKKTYVVSLQTQVLARVDAKKHKEQIQRNADWLLQEAIFTKDKLDGWSYPANQIGDGSNTHFAVMGLQAAKEAGAKVEEKMWLQIAEHYMRTQKPGGWRYYSTNDADFRCSHSMTACALMGLAIASKHIKDTKELDAASEKGLKILATWDLFSAKSSGYAMMVVAELGRARGAKEFKVGDNTWEWYRIGAEKVVKSQKDDGSCVFEGGAGIDGKPLLATSFGLFLLGPPEQGNAPNPRPKR